MYVSTNSPAVSVQVTHTIPASVAIIRGLSSSPMALCGQSVVVSLFAKPSSCFSSSDMSLRDCVSAQVYIHVHVHRCLCASLYPKRWEYEADGW